MVRMRVALPVALALAAIGVSGCGSKDNGNGQAAATSSSEKPDQKYRGYVSAYNVLIAEGTGLAAAAGAYASYNIPTRVPSSTISLSFNPDYLAGTVDELKKARAAPGSSDTAALDTAADALIPPLEEIVKAERELGPYYTGRAYRADGLAKGKAADGPLKATFARALTAIDPMKQAIAAHQRAVTATQVAKLRADGNVAEASLADAMQKAAEMIDALGRGDDAAAAKQSAMLATALDQMRADQPKLKPLAGNVPAYKNVLENLTNVQGQFSDYQNGKASAKQGALENYNLAVSTANIFRMPS